MVLWDKVPRSGAGGLAKVTQFPEGDMIVVSNDHVIEHLDAEDLARADEFASDS